MCPRVPPRAVGAHIDIASVPRRLHFVQQLDHGARWRVFLGVVVNLPGPRAVFFLIREQPRGLANYAQEHIHSYREVGTPHQRAAIRLHGCTHLIHVFQPTCGTHHYRQFHRSQPLDIAGHRLGRRKLDRHIRTRSLGEIVADIDRHNRREPILRRELLDQPSHLSVTDNRQFHGSCSYSKAAGSGFVKNSWCSDSTALFRSAAATTRLIFSSDAPCEIIRTFMFLSAAKARDATPGVCRMLSPTMHTMAWLSSTVTSANSSISLVIAGRELVLSMVSETLTSEVASMSTGVS